MRVADINYAIEKLLVLAVAVYHRSKKFALVHIGDGLIIIRDDSRCK